MLLRDKKKLILGVIMGIMVMTPLHATFNANTPFDIKHIERTDLDNEIKHNPLFGLFGFGVVSTTKEKKEAAFNAYYEFCSETDKAVDLEKATILAESSAKENFKEVLLKATALLAKNNNDDGIDKVSIQIDKKDINSNNINDIYNNWKTAHLCDHYLTYTSNVTPENGKDDAREGSYGLVKDEDLSLIGVNGKSIQHRQFYKGDRRLVRMCYKNDEDGKNIRDRDIALLFSDKNKDVMMKFINDAGSSISKNQKLAEDNNLVKDITNVEINKERAKVLFLVHHLFFAPHSSFGSVDNVEVEFKSTMYPVTSNDTESINVNKFKVRPYNILTNKAIGAKKFNKVNLQDNTLLNTGLGYYCDEINRIHDSAKATIGPCVKAHMSSYIEADENRYEICSNGKCEEDIEFYKTPSFAYCSFDNDNDGYLDKDALDNKEFDWGKLDDVKKTPYTDTQDPKGFDLCPDNSNLNTSQGEIWYKEDDETDAEYTCISDSTDLSVSLNGVNYVKEKPSVTTEKANEAKKAAVTTEKANEPKKAAVTTEKANEAKKAAVTTDKTNEAKKAAVTTEKANEPKKVVVTTDKENAAELLKNINSITNISTLDLDPNVLNSIYITPADLVSKFNKALGRTDLTEANIVTNLQVSVSADFSVTHTQTEKIEKILLTRSATPTGNIKELNFSKEGSVKELKIFKRLAKTSDGKEQEPYQILKGVSFENKELVAKLESSQTKLYCMKVASAFDASVNFLIRIDANSGLITTYQFIGGSAAKGAQIQKISLNEDGTLKEGVKLNKDIGNGSSECAYTKIPDTVQPQN